LTGLCALSGLQAAERFDQVGLRMMLWRSSTARVRWPDIRMTADSGIPRRRVLGAAYSWARVVPIPETGCLARVTEGMPGTVMVCVQRVTLPYLVSQVLGISLRAVFAWQRRRVRAYGIRGLCGSVTSVQRFGAHLNLNVHFHALVPLGLPSDPPPVAPARPPPDQQMAS
jgi:hypothetical protein